MVHDFADILLRESVQRRAFGDDPPNQGVVVFYRTLLVRRLRIAVEDPRPRDTVAILFQGNWI